MQIHVLEKTSFLKSVAVIILSIIMKLNRVQSNFGAHWFSVYGQKTDLQDIFFCVVTWFKFLIMSVAQMVCSNFQHQH